MNDNEYLQHWNYFCSLAKLLDNTKDYVYHGVKDTTTNDIDLVNANVYSDAFKQIIFLGGAEFEILARIICSSYGYEANNIIDFSDVILTELPKITNTEVMTMYWEGLPLKNWCVDKVKAGKKVSGIDWWDAYSNLKHNELNSYESASLENAVLTLSSLYVIHLYMMYKQFGNLGLLSAYPTVYFKSKYEPANVFAAEGKLPDFGNMSAVEAYKEMIDSFN